jgi:hypothetical protein
MIICQICKSQTDDGAIFCETCGNELAAFRQSATPTLPPAHPGAFDRAPFAAGVIPTDALRDTGHHVAPVTIRLTLVTGQEFVLRGKYEYLIGRGAPGYTDLDVSLNDSHGYVAPVSRNHIKIYVVADGVFVEDLDSKNETVQNGYRLQAEQWYPLHTGDKLQLGSVTLDVTFERP